MKFLSVSCVLVFSSRSIMFATSLGFYNIMNFLCELTALIGHHCGLYAAQIVSKCAIKRIKNICFAYFMLELTTECMLVKLSKSL